MELNDSLKVIWQVYFHRHYSESGQPRKGHAHLPSHSVLLPTGILRVVPSECLLAWLRPKDMVQHSHLGFITTVSVIFRGVQIYLGSINARTIS